MDSGCLTLSERCSVSSRTKALVLSSRCFKVGYPFAKATIRGYSPNTLFLPCFALFQKLRKKRTYQGAVIKIRIRPNIRQTIRPERNTSS